VGAHQIPPVPPKYLPGSNIDGANLLKIAPLTNSLMLAALKNSGTIKKFMAILEMDDYNVELATEVILLNK